MNRDSFFRTTFILLSVFLLVVATSAKSDDGKVPTLATPSWIHSSGKKGSIKSVEGPIKISLKGKLENVSVSVNRNRMSETLRYSKQRAIAYRFVDVYQFENSKWTFQRTDKYTTDGAFAKNYDPPNFQGQNSAEFLGYDTAGFKFNLTEPRAWHVTDVTIRR